MSRINSSKTVAATIRKQRQRRRQKDAGLKKLEIHVTAPVIALLEQIVKVSGGTFKEDAEIAMRRSLGAYLEEVTKARAHGLGLWNRLQEYLPYRSYLQAPGAVFRLKDRVFSEAELATAQREFEQFIHVMKKRGWTEKKTLRMLEKASKEEAKKQVHKKLPLPLQTTNDKD